MINLVLLSMLFKLLMEAEQYLPHVISALFFLFFFNLF